MNQNKDTFNINKVAIPLNRSELETVINKTVTVGYIPVNYDRLIETIKSISSATEYSVTVNPNIIYTKSNHPNERADCLIKVEGMQTYQEFMNTIVRADDNYEWSNFITYSVNFKDEIKRMKEVAYRKYLWNYHNIDSWVTSKNVSILSDDKNMLTTNFDMFKERVLNSDDFIGFIDACLDTDVNHAISFMVKHGCEILRKYKVELNNHIRTNNMREENLILKNPIILKIFMQPSAASRCRKDWPKIRFTTLDKKTFDTIGVWEK